MGKKLLILGGGIGGVTAALELSGARRKYGFDLEVTIVDRSEWHYAQPLWLDVVCEGLPLEATRAPIRGLEKYGVRVVIGEVAGIDLANRRVLLASGDTLEYDYLIITLGTRREWNGIPGYSIEGYHSYTPEGALSLRDALREFRGGRIVIAIPEAPFSYELYPMELATLLGYKLRVRGVKSSIVVLSPELPGGKDITQILGPDVHRLWTKHARRYGVKVKRHKGIQRIDTERRVVVTRGFEEPYDLLIKIPLPRPPKVLEGEGFARDQTGRFIMARPRDFRHPNYDEVFLTGEHSMPPTGLGMSGAFAQAATRKAVQVLMRDEYGIDRVQEIPPVTCAAYAGDKGFTVACEVKFNGETYTWRNCYNVLEGRFMRVVKRSLYQGWLDRLRA